MSYLIFSDATADYHFALLQDAYGVKIIPMNVETDGNVYLYGPGGNITTAEFYAMLRAGKYASTSQINPFTYYQYFEPCLKEGKDILYLCFSSGLSSTYQSALLCADELLDQYPERKIICIDSLAASVGLGFLVNEAAHKQAEGFSLDELASWVVEHQLQVCHWFTVDTLDHLKHGGRISSAAALIGNTLQIKPLLHVDDNGRLVVAGKPRGRKKAMSALLSHMEEGWQKDLGRRVLIGHADCIDRAIQLKGSVMAHFPDAEVTITDIGPIIGAHTGPGMLALIYWGSNR